MLVALVDGDGRHALYAAAAAIVLGDSVAQEGDDLALPTHDVVGVHRHWGDGGDRCVQVHQTQVPGLVEVVPVVGGVHLKLVAFGIADDAFGFVDAWRHVEQDRDALALVLLSGLDAVRCRDDPFGMNQGPGAEAGAAISLVVGEHGPDLGVLACALPVDHRRCGLSEGKACKDQHRSLLTGAT